MKIYLAGNGQGNRNWRRICFDVQTNKRLPWFNGSYFARKRGTLVIWEL